MIKSHTINNFQSHLNSTLEFSNGINCIIGDTDAGKSAIMRTFTAIFKKSPFYLTRRTDSGNITTDLGDAIIFRTRTDFRLLKCPNCKTPVEKDVQICKDCGEVFSRKPQEDKYEVDGKIQPKFGVTLPDQILEKTRIRPITFNEFEFDINFQEQDDDMFFIGKSFNAARNKMISALCKESELIDNAIRKCRNTANSLKTRYDSLAKENESLDLIESLISTDVQELNNNLKYISDNESYIELLSSDIYDLEELKKQLDKKYILNEIPKVSKADEILKKIYNNITKVEKFAGDISQIDSLITDIKKLQPLNECDITKVDIDFLQTLLNEINTLEKDIYDMNSISKAVAPYRKYTWDVFADIDGLKNSIDFLTTSTEELNTLSKEFEEIERIVYKLNKPIYNSIDPLPEFNLWGVEILNSELGELEAIQNSLEVQKGLISSYKKDVRETDIHIKKCYDGAKLLMEGETCPLTGDVFCDGCTEKILERK